MTLERLKFHYSIAKSAMQQRDFERAQDEFLSLLALDPSLDFAHYNLASCYIELKQFQKAYDHYFYVASLKGELSRDPDLFFNLGVCAEKLSQFEHAEGFYQQSIQLNPENFPAYFNLGLLAKFLKKIPLAINSFESAKNLNPDHAEVRFHLARLTGETLDSLPNSHIKSLFDEYADHYDIHMQNNLAYQLPEFMASLISENLELKNLALNFLDLGCGTGLLGKAVLKKLNLEIGNLEIDGVDLSPKMLEHARQSWVYSRLFEEDFVAYLASCPEESYDGIMAADVLNYLGDLSLFFREACRALKPGGFICFSVEDLVGEGAQEDFRLCETGRVAHNQSYVKDCINKAHPTLLKTKKIESISARTQLGKDVKEVVYLLSFFEN
jgi:predicted TPR repeat methyltransferase